MRLDIGVYGALLVAGLGAAYWVSLPEPSETDEERLSIFQVEPKAISEVAFKSKDIDATATRRDDGRYWVTHTKTETAAPAKPDPAKKDQPPPKAEPKVTTEHFLANEKMEELQKSFNPFYAARIIGTVDAKQLEDFGLKDKTEAFTLKADGGKVFKLFLGKRSYGSRNRFAQEDGDKGRVLLVDDSSFENLERAPLRMYDRRLVGFEMVDVQKAQLHAGDKLKNVAHTQRDKSGELTWTADEENAQPKPQLGSFMDKLAKLRLTAYAEPAEEESLKAAKPFLEVTFEKDGKPLDHIAFYKTGGDKPAYFVTSDFLKIHGKLAAGRIEPVEKDIGQVLSDNKS